MISSQEMDQDYSRATGVRMVPYIHIAAVVLIAGAIVPLALTAGETWIQYLKTHFIINFTLD